MPIEVNNIFLNSMGFILDKDKAAMWRGPMLSGAIKQLKDLTEWGDLDYLFIDMPPGTGDAYLTVASEIKPNHVLLVTSQSKLAVQDTIKSKAMFEKLKIPIIGLVDNMSYSIYPNSVEQFFEFLPINLEDEIGLKVLGSIPRTKDLANFNPNKLSTFFEPLYNELIKVS
jgi:ATP-binding protein involved in chromosome partitioning